MGSSHRTDVYVDTVSLSGINQNEDHFTNYYARVDDIDFIISSQERCHYDITIGEFCKTRYNLYNNYNYNKIKSLLINRMDFLNFDLQEEDSPYLHIYNISYLDYQLMITSEADLIEAYTDSYYLYTWMIESYPSPRFCVIMSIQNSTRPLYVCTQRDKHNQLKHGFQETSLEALLAEYHQFYE
ncbi:hypothetical protein [Paracholeplasma manati]|uniref:hypothetical protein n=1 Tax=Paracholeplasma manati TaxID=591373 RepID=UPI0024079FA2|nr:hypothetical protein [Paracholeplasma manati]